MKHYWLVTFSLFLGCAGSSSSTSNPDVNPTQATSLMNVGANEGERINAIAVDSSNNIYVAGEANAESSGVSMGVAAAMLAKYKSDGTLIWKKTLASGHYDIAYGVAVDSNGNVFVGGTTNGIIAGSQNYGFNDTWVAKYQADGTFVWAKQYGMSMNDTFDAIVVDGSGNVTYSASENGFAYTNKLDNDGNLIWGNLPISLTIRHSAKGLAVDRDGNLYQSGLLSDPALSKLNFYVAKILPNQTIAWKKEYDTGSSSKNVAAVDVDHHGNVFVTGQVVGAYAGNTNGVAVIKYSNDGTFLWHKYVGDFNDEARGIKIDAAGNAYVTAVTYAQLPGFENLGLRDVFVSKISASGNLISQKQFGTTNDDLARGISLDSSNNIFIGGYTALHAGPGGGDDGGWNAFIAKLNLN